MMDNAIKKNAGKNTPMPSLALRYGAALFVADRTQDALKGFDRKLTRSIERIIRK